MIYKDYKVARYDDLIRVIKWHDMSPLLYMLICIKSPLVVIG